MVVALTNREIIQTDPVESLHMTVSITPTYFHCYWNNENRTNNETTDIFYTTQLKFACSCHHMQYWLSEICLMHISRLQHATI